MEQDLGGEMDPAQPTQDLSSLPCPLGLRGTKQCARVGSFLCPIYSTYHCSCFVQLKRKLPPRNPPDPLWEDDSRSSSSYASVVLAS